MTVKTKKQSKLRRLLERLEQRCNQSIESFASYGQTTMTVDGPLTFIDRGANVLGVAHLDTVDWVLKSDAKPDNVVWYQRKKGDLPIVNSIKLDDRLGAWLLLDVLPAMGVNVDVLLTDGEESGRSTAKHFKPSKQYNWGFSFDRRGADVVLYDYEDSKQWVTELDNFGFTIGNGTFSDISKLDIGACCANFGAGYHNEHSHNCYADLADTIDMAKAFKDWHELHHATYFKYTPRPKLSLPPYYVPFRFRDVPWWAQKWDDEVDEIEDDSICPICNSTMTPAQGECLICGYTKEDIDRCYKCGRATLVQTDEGYTCDYCGEAYD